MAASAEPPSLIVRPGRRVPDRDGLAQFARTLQQRLAGGASFHCLLTGDEELRQLNRRFRGKNESTDVLSFPGHATAAPAHLGDIAVSLDHARRQAREHGHSAHDEIRVLMLHGVLHLLGMDHETDGGQMRAAEAAWRRKLGLPAGLIERTDRAA